MQTLFLKKNKLIKKNNYLVSIFYGNIILITILTMNIIPGLGTGLSLFLISLIGIIEGLIVRGVFKDNKIIQDLEEQIEFLKMKEQEKQNKIEKNQLEEIVALTNEKIFNDDFLTKETPKIKKKTL